MRPGFAHADHLTLTVAPAVVRQDRDHQSHFHLLPYACGLQFRALARKTAPETQAKMEC